MNRTGLLIVLGLAAVVGAAFALWPQLDIGISGLFYDPVQHQFWPRLLRPFSHVRGAAQWIVAALAAPAGLALLLKLLLPRRRMFISARGAIFLLGTLALGPGLLVNVTLKDYWPRSRPIDIAQFEGTERFTPWWDPRGSCVKNCSTVAGEPSGAFWTLAPAALAPPQWRPLAYAGALAFGSAVGALRIAFGGHFFTDVVFAGVLVFLVIWIAHGLLYRWRTAPSETAVEAAVKRLALALRTPFLRQRHGPPEGPKPARLPEH
jgi:lipid A 4'-phosphatase